MRRAMICASAAVVVGAGAFAAVSLGGEGASRPADFDRSFERVQAHPTEQPSASTAATARAGAKGKPKVKYFETAAVPVPAVGADFVTGCPSKYKALSGYFLTTGAIAPDTSAISEDSPRNWEFGFVNLAGAPGQAIIGVVCGKKL